MFLLLSVLLGAAVADPPAEKGKWVAISEGVTAKVEPKWPGLAAGIAVDPSLGDIYMVISGLGVWKSKNHGKSFEQVDGGNVGGRCETGAAISVDPAGGGRLAFFQFDGRSAWTPDGGKTWKKVSDLKPTGRTMVHYQTIGYWLHDRGILVSRDRGATWTAEGGEVAAWFGPYFGKDQRHRIVVGKAGFHESTDGGATWTVVAPTPDVKDFNGPWFPNYAWDARANIFYASRMGRPAYKLVR